MQRLIATLLLLSLLLTGCADRLKEPVTFYYIRAGYDMDMSDVMGSEQREAAGHRDDLSYLLALYLMGPAEDELLSPLPHGTSILSAEQTGSTVTLHLSDTSESMTDAQFTLACSCLTMTCLDLTEATHITIISGDRSVTMNADMLLTQDLTTAAIPEDSQ